MFNWSSKRKGERQKVGQNNWREPINLQIQGAKTTPSRINTIQITVTCHDKQWRPQDNSVTSLK